MDTHSQIILSLSIYKVLCLAVGSLFSYLGYKLFMAGMWGKSGDLKADFGKNSLVLKKAAPGTFFALFGAVIISFTIFKGLRFDQKTNMGTNHENPTEISENQPEGFEDIPF